MTRGSAKCARCKSAAPILAAVRRWFSAKARFDLAFDKMDAAVALKAQNDIEAALEALARVCAAVDAEAKSASDFRAAFTENKHGELP